jgi:FdhD protein
MSAERPGTSERIRLRAVSAAGAVELEDEVATEEPLEIRVGGSSGTLDPIPLAVTMRTPGHDFELAAGFLVSEGVVRTPDEIDRISYCTDPGVDQQFDRVNVVLRPAASFDPERFRRNVYVASSCGICGTAALERVRAQLLRPPEGAFRVATSVLVGLPAQLREAQQGFGRTGGVHAAGLFQPDGRRLLVREDVGRHNAVDKLVGHRWLAGQTPSSDTILLVSGRASFELVQKAAIAGIPFLAAVGAPSNLAVDLARDQGMTLVGFLRDDRFNVYTGPERTEPGP